MLAKILVGVLAAIMVSGAGVYFAFSDSCDHQCSGSSDGAVSQSACSTPQPPCCSGHDDEGCSDDKACTADATGAFIGSAALTAKTGCKKACCDE